MFLKPKAGLVVRDPVTKFPLPVEGREVALSSYWERRIRAGDVEPVPTPAAKTIGSTALAAPSEETEP